MKKQIAGMRLALASTLGLLWFAGCEPAPSNPQTNQAEVHGEAIATPVTDPAKAPTPPPSKSAIPAKPEPVAANATQPFSSGPKVEIAKSPEPAKASVPKPAAPETKTEDGFLQIGFEKLASFNYEVPDGPVEAKAGEKVTPLKPGQIPSAVISLNKKKIALQGFMLPLKVENGLITELLIMRDQSMCCYGNVPKINEWVSVKMTGKGVKPIMDQAVTLYGTLKVGEMLENGYLVGIYEMAGERMAGPLEL